MTDRYYISTPIYYPNAAPHLGHVYTTVCADALARHSRLRGRDTFFLTGCDEHGIKMVKAAAEVGLEAAELARQNVPAFQNLWTELGISNDEFIRTTDERHKRSVLRIVEKMLGQGDIYLGNYEGWYDEGQEEFVTETEAKAADFRSAISGRPLVRYQEPTYFFRLTRYVEPVRHAIESDRLRVRPESRRNEILSKLRGWDQDLSISRTSLTWGIALPNDPRHVLYVWIDALSNYITALGYGETDDARMRRFWPADVHLIGKEILWFHAFYWPAMLLSLGLDLPGMVFAHGWWTAEGRKMSKSLGNFIDLDRLRAARAQHGLDAVRFYLLRAAPFGSDLDWNDTDLVKAFNELANVVGNCLNRVLRMIGRYRGGRLPPCGPLTDLDRSLIGQTEGLADAVAAAYDRVELQQAAVLPVELARMCNGYIDATEPFKLAKDPAGQGRLDTVLHVSAQAIARALALLLPVLPEKARDGLAQLNLDADGATLDRLARPLPDGHALREGQPLFPRPQ